MNEQTDLPPDVISAIRAHRKIEAIKMLRELRGLGLKEAKDAVEAYERDNPHLMAPRSESGGGPLLLVAIVAAAAFAVYWFLK